METTMSHCITGNARIITDNGLGRAEDLYNMGTATVVSVADSIAESKEASITQESSSVYTAGKDTVIKVETEEGYTIRVSPSHQFRVDGEWKEAESLQNGDNLELLDHQGLFGKHGTYEEGVVQGVLSENNAPSFTDSSFSISFENISSSASPEVVQLYEWVSAMSKHEDGREIQLSEVSSEQLENALEQSSINRGSLQSEVSESVFTGSRELVRGYLQAISELRGNIQDPDEDLMQIEIYGDDTTYLTNIQLLLLNFGVTSTLDRLPEASNRLVIEGESVVMFVENIGLLDKSSEYGEQVSKLYDEQESELLDMGCEYTATVESIETDGTENVYGLTEPTTESYISNGFVSKS